MPENSVLEATVTRCTLIEEHLRSLGADGSGIYELVDSISSELPTDLKQQVKHVATIRNRFVHEYGYSFPGSEAAFLSELDAVIAGLEKLRSEDAPFPSPPNEGVSMSKSNPWV